MGLLNSLIEQAKAPKGFVGKTMLKIMNSAHTTKTAWGLSKLNIVDNALILDIGCGGGKTMGMLSAKSQHSKIYGIDYSEDAVLTSAKENYKDVQSGKVIVKQASVSSIPFNDNFFDIITAIQTHYFWPDLKNDIKEVYRVLKPKGEFALVAEVYKINYHMKEYKAVNELKGLFLSSGFFNVDVFETRQDLCFVGRK